MIPRFKAKSDRAWATQSPNLRGSKLVFWQMHNRVLGMIWVDQNLLMLVIFQDINWFPQAPLASSQVIKEGTTKMQRVGLNSKSLHQSQWIWLMLFITKSNWWERHCNAFTDTTWWIRPRGWTIELQSNAILSNLKWRPFAPCTHSFWIILVIKIARDRLILYIVTSYLRRCCKYGMSNGKLKQHTNTKLTQCKTKWLCELKSMYSTNGKQFLWHISFIKHKRQQVPSFGKVRSVRRLIWAWNSTRSSRKRKSAWIN